MAMRNGRQYAEIGTPRAAAWGMTECPVCGADHYCMAVEPGTVFQLWSDALKKRVEQRVDGAVMCMAGLAGPPGFLHNGMQALGRLGPNGGRYFVPSEGGRAVTDEEWAVLKAKREKARQADEAKRLKNIKAAIGLVNGAVPSHPSAAAYFAGRGVPVVAGDLPPSIRYAERVEYFDESVRYEPGPAVVGVVTDAVGAVVACHRIYVARDGSPTKRAAEDCGERGSKLALGSVGGAAVRLGVVGGDPAARRVLVLTEGIETGMMIRFAAGLVAGGGAVEVWSCISGSGLTSIEVPASVAANLAKIVVAGDLDKWDAKRGARPGHVYANRAAARLREMCPGVEVVVAIPGHGDAPGLVDEAGAPRTKGGCDWLDVGQGDDGPRRVAAGVFGAVSREKATPGVAAWEEALARTRASESAAADGEGEDRTRASESGSPDDGERARTRASESEGAETGEGGEEGGGGGGGGVWRADGGYFEKDGKKILPGGDLRRARIAIRMLYMPPEGARAGERFTLAWWVEAQQWMRWNGRRYEAVHKDAVRGDVSILYLDWWTVNAEGRLVSAKLSTHQAASIVEALKTDLSVKADGLPAWAPPTIGSDGRPLFDTMREVPACASPHGRPVISFANGLLDLEALRAEGKVVLSGHTPRLITTNAMDYSLPVEEIAAELESDSAGEARGGVLCSRLCPGWMRYMSDISKGDDDVPRALQQYLGYVLAPTCEYERFLYLIGVPGVGKGTFVDVAASLVGPDAVASTSLNKLSGPFALQPLVGKRVLILDEMGAGHSTDAVEATRCLLSIVGNAPQTVDLKNRDAIPQVRLNAKIIATGNRLAKFQDPSDAFGRRVLIVRIPKVSRKHDPRFKAKMVAESGGIMVWAIFGLLDLWRSGGFVQPANGMELRKMLRRLSSRVAAFVEDCAVLSGSEAIVTSGGGDAGPGGGNLVSSAGVSVRASVLYKLFENWSEAKGMRPLSMEDFAADLASNTEDFREDTMRVGEDQFSVWHGVRPRLAIDLPGRADWDDRDLAVSSLPVLGSGTVARLVGNAWYAHHSAAARYAPMGFNTEEAGEDSVV